MMTLGYVDLKGETLTFSLGRILHVKEAISMEVFPSGREVENVSSQEAKPKTYYYMVYTVGTL